MIDLLNSYRVKKCKKYVLGVILFLIVFLLCKKITGLIVERFMYPEKIVISVKSQYDDVIQLFYDNDKANIFDEENSIKVPIRVSNDFEKLEFVIPKKKIKNIRIDLGNRPQKIIIKNISIEGMFNKQQIGPIKILEQFKINNDIKQPTIENNVVFIESKGNDPFIYDNNFLLNSNYSKYITLILSLLTTIVLCFFLFFNYNYLLLIILRYKKYSFDLCIIMVFLISIFLPMAGKILNIDKTGSNIEKREMAIKPQLELNYNKLMNFGKVYEKYFNDNFGFRNLLVRLNNEFKINYLNESPVPDVILGKKEWLFYGSQTDGSKSLEDYMCTDLFTEGELAKIKDNLEKQRVFLENKGIHFIFTIAPNKSTIYPEYMPNNIRQGKGKSRLDQVQEYLEKNTQIDVIDLKKPLLEAKNQNLMYYITDSHWNNYGAFVGYTQLINKVKEYYPNIKSLKQDDYKISYSERSGGDLAAMLSMNNKMKDMESIFRPIHESKIEEIKVDYDNSIAYKIHNVKLPRLVMFRDSFTTALTPYLSQNFSQSTYIWDYGLNMDIIIKEKANVVIYEIVERNLDLILNLN